MQLFDIWWRPRKFLELEPNYEEYVPAFQEQSLKDTSTHSWYSQSVIDNSHDPESTYRATSKTVRELNMFVLVCDDAICHELIYCFYR